MADKFTNEDISELSQKLKWKPNNLSYIILYVSIFCLISIIIIIIYFILLTKHINCKFKEVQKQIKKLQTDVSLEKNMLKDNMTNNTNAIRYLISTSENKANNRSLAEKYFPESIQFENEKENPLLSFALAGK